MNLIRLFTAGNIDDGKSTLIGRLLLDSGAVSTDIIQGLTKINELGQENPEIDLVIGNRMNNPKGMPFVRRHTNVIMSALISAAAGQKVPDTQCGYRAAKREAIGRLQLESSRFEIESEMILEAARTHSRISSVPVRSVYEGGTSHIHPLRDTVRFFKFLFKYLACRK